MSINKKKELNYYLALKWTYTIEEESCDGYDYYVIRVNELPGVCTDSDTLKEGMADIKEAIKAAIKLYIKHDDPIPEPVDKDKYKGNIAYRTSSERHYIVAKIAQQKHKSMSKVLDLLIDSGISQLHSPRRT